MKRGSSTGSSTISYEEYGYDPMSRLTSVSRKDGTLDSFSYYLDGELNTAQYGAAGSSSLSMATQDSALADGTASSDGADSADPSMAWPPLDGSWQDSVEGLLSSDTGASAGGVALSTDTTSASLDSMQMSTLSTNASSSVTYNLDKAGNRLSVVEDGVSKSYSRNNLNQYTVAEGTAVSNGNEHEISAYQGINYSYINDERLSVVTDGANSYSLAYDALGRCVKRTVTAGSTTTTNYYVYDGEKPILEYDTSGAMVAWNLYGKGIDEILERVDVPHNWTLNYQQDHEGSVIYVTNVNGYMIAKYRYDVFGAPTFYNYQGTQVSTSPFNNRFLFTGREYAATFSFYEYRARAYNPTLGRFMSEDPKLFDAGDYNLYRYCHNDPEDMTDPMGLDLRPIGNEEDIARWNQAYAAWMASPTMHPLLNAIAKSGVDVPVQLNSDKDNGLYSNGRLHFDSYHGGELLEGGFNSPGVRGAHEIKHVYDKIRDSKTYMENEGKKDLRSIGPHKATLSSPNEESAMKTERQYARERGEPARPRYEPYKSQPETRGVNSNVPASQPQKPPPPKLPEPQPRP